MSTITNTRKTGLATIKETCDYLRIGKSTFYKIRRDSEAKDAINVPDEDKIEVLYVTEGRPMIEWDEIYRYLNQRKKIQTESGNKKPPQTTKRTAGTGTN